MPQDGQIDYLEFTTGDVKKSKEFYGHVFGWKFQDYGPEYTSFDDGRLAGGFAAMPNRNEPLVVIYVANLESFVDKVKSAGGSIVKPIFSFPGGRRFHLNDPDGNELAVWSDKYPVGWARPVAVPAVAELRRNHADQTSG
jgi:predicted enzyme related to lactoylglutathione lyase